MHFNKRKMFLNYFLDLICSNLRCYFQKNLNLTFMLSRFLAQFNEYREKYNAFEYYLNKI